MQAVIRTGGKQYYVTPGDILEVEKLAGNIGEAITLDDVLMVAGDEDVTIGQPTVSDAAVTARITGQYRGNKIRVFRYRPKKRIRVRRGHRQYITRLEIQSITWGDQEFTAPVPAPAPEPEIAEPVIEETVAEEAAAEDTIVAEATEESAVEAQNDADSADEATDVVADADANVANADEANGDEADASDADEKKE